MGSVAPNSRSCLLKLKVQLHAKLKLSRVKRGCRTAVITTVGSTLIERSHVVDEWRGRRLIEAIEEIKALGNQFEPHVFSKRNKPRQSHIQRHVSVCEAKVAPQTAAGENAIGDQTNTALSACHTKSAVRQNRWSVGLV